MSVWVLLFWNDIMEVMCVIQANLTQKNNVRLGFLTGTGRLLLKQNNPYHNINDRTDVHPYLQPRGNIWLPEVSFDSDHKRLRHRARAFSSRCASCSSIRPKLKILLHHRGKVMFLYGVDQMSNHVNPIEYRTILILTWRQHVLKEWVDQWSSGRGRNVNTLLQDRKAH